MEVLREGYMILFSRRPPLSDQPLPMPSYSLSSIRGRALEKEFLDFLHKGAIEQAPQTPGFYSRLFVVQKDSGSWRPIIDLSTLNTSISFFWSWGGFWSRVGGSSCDSWFWSLLMLGHTFLMPSPLPLLPSMAVGWSWRLVFLALCLGFVLLASRVGC